ncbi:toll/interleukin-1 receptor domain-containing protein [Variovorax sp.]|jgi:hypothetical protein|uniref:toll/interleukin-1 receptor domain-containing protein n=1 Tax=Variovorax sp. TaxID=1871043 RepID=UPI0037DA20D5
MKVFISWSGTRSHAVAQVLREWVTAVIQAARPWLSSEDIQRGAQWLGDIGHQLQESTVGIFCLTQKNKTAPWILFEAGAVAKGVPTSRICTLLIDLEPGDVFAPLSQFNHTKLSREDMFKLATTLNAALGENRLTDPQLKKSFEAHWGSFEADIQRAINDNPEEGPAAKKPDQTEVLEEVLSSLRSIGGRLSRLERIPTDTFQIGSALSRLQARPLASRRGSPNYTPAEIERLVASMSEADKDLFRLAFDAASDSRADRGDIPAEKS